MSSDVYINSRKDNQETCKYELSPGYNLVSFPLKNIVESGGSNLINNFSVLKANGIVGISDGKRSAEYIEGIGWHGSLTELDPKRGYWIEVHDNVNFEITGELAIPGVDFKRGLVSNKEIISFHPSWIENLTEDVFENITSHITSIISGEGESRVWMGNDIGWAGSLENLTNCNGSSTGCCGYILDQDNVVTSEDNQVEPGISPYRPGWHAHDWWWDHDHGPIDVKPIKPLPDPYEDCYDMPTSEMEWECEWAVCESGQDPGCEHVEGRPTNCPTWNHIAYQACVASGWELGGECTSDALSSGFNWPWPHDNADNLDNNPNSDGNECTYDETTCQYPYLYQNYQGNQSIAGTWFSSAVPCDGSAANCIENTCVPWWVFQPRFKNSGCCGVMHCDCSCGENSSCDEECCPEFLHTGESWCALCDDDSACNYGEDSTCLYPTDGPDGGCDDPSIGGNSTVCNCDGNCISDDDGDGVCNENEIGGCIDETACNFNENATDDNGTCTYADEFYDCDGNCLVELDECGDCADGASFVCWDAAIVCGPGDCLPYEDTPESGCVDPSACNYKPSATFPGPCYYQNIECCQDNNADGYCDLPLVTETFCVNSCINVSAGKWIAPIGNITEMPSWDNDAGLRDCGLGWNFNDAFGEGTWEANVEDITDSPIPELTKALHVKITNFGSFGSNDGGGSFRSLSGTGGFFMNHSSFDGLSNSYFKAWVKVISGKVQMGHSGTNNYITQGPTNSKWKLIYNLNLITVRVCSCDDGTDVSLIITEAECIDVATPVCGGGAVPGVWGETDYTTENNEVFELFVDANNDSSSADIWFLEFGLYDTIDDNYQGENCCCVYEYDCYGNIISPNDYAGLSAEEECITCASYDDCGVCAGGVLSEPSGTDYSTGLDLGTDNLGCGCFQPDNPIWYLDQDLDGDACECSTGLNSCITLADEGEVADYGYGLAWYYCPPDNFHPEEPLHQYPPMYITQYATTSEAVAEYGNMPVCGNDESPGIAYLGPGDTFISLIDSVNPCNGLSPCCAYEYANCLIDKSKPIAVGDLPACEAGAVTIAIGTGECGENGQCLHPGYLSLESSQSCYCTHEWYDCANNCMDPNGMPSEYQGQIYCYNVENSYACCVGPNCIGYEYGDFTSYHDDNTCDGACSGIAPCDDPGCCVAIDHLNASRFFANLQECIDSPNCATEDCRNRGIGLDRCNYCYGNSLSGNWASYWNQETPFCNFDPSAWIPVYQDGLIEGVQFDQSKLSTASLYDANCSCPMSYAPYSCVSDLGITNYYNENTCGECTPCNETGNPGPAFIDSCSTVVGGTTNLPANWAMDSCGVCYGNSWSNETKMDLNYVCIAPDGTLGDTYTGTPECADAPGGIENCCGALGCKTCVYMGGITHKEYAHMGFEPVEGGVWCNYGSSGSSFGCDCQCGSGHEFDDCGQCGGFDSFCSGCGEWGTAISQDQCEGNVFSCRCNWKWCEDGCVKPGDVYQTGEDGTEEICNQGEDPETGHGCNPKFDPYGVAYGPSNPWGYPYGPGCWGYYDETVLSQNDCFPGCCIIDEVCSPEHGSGYPLATLQDKIFGWARPEFGENIIGGYAQKIVLNPIEWNSSDISATELVSSYNLLSNDDDWSLYYSCLGFVNHCASNYELYPNFASRGHCSDYMTCGLDYKTEALAARTQIYKCDGTVPGEVYIRPSSSGNCFVASDAWAMGVLYDESELSATVDAYTNAVESKRSSGEFYNMGYYIDVADCEANHIFPDLEGSPDGGTSRLSKSLSDSMRPGRKKMESLKNNKKDNSGSRNTRSSTRSEGSVNDCDYDSACTSHYDCPLADDGQMQFCIFGGSGLGDPLVIGDDVFQPGFCCPCNVYGTIYQYIAGWEPGKQNIPGSDNGTCRSGEMHEDSIADGGEYDNDVISCCNRACEQSYDYCDAFATSECEWWCANYDDPNQDMYDFLAQGHCYYCPPTCDGAGCPGNMGTDLFPYQEFIPWINDGDCVSGSYDTLFDSGGETCAWFDDQWMLDQLGEYNQLEECVNSAWDVECISCDETDQQNGVDSNYAADCEWLSGAYLYGGLNEDQRQALCAGNWDVSCHEVTYPGYWTCVDSAGSDYDFCGTQCWGGANECYDGAFDECSCLWWVDMSDFCQDCLFCTEHSECGDGEYCDDGYCVTGCISHDDCSDGYYCDAGNDCWTCTGGGCCDYPADQCIADTSVTPNLPSCGTDCPCLNNCACQSHEDCYSDEYCADDGDCKDCTPSDCDGDELPDSIDNFCPCCVGDQEYGCSSHTDCCKEDGTNGEDSGYCDINDTCWTDCCGWNDPCEDCGECPGGSCIVAATGRGKQKDKKNKLLHSDTPSNINDNISKREKPISRYPEKTISGYAPGHGPDNKVSRNDGNRWGCDTQCCKDDLCESDQTANACTENYNEMSMCCGCDENWQCNNDDDGSEGCTEDTSHKSGIWTWNDGGSFIECYDENGDAIIGDSFDYEFDGSLCCLCEDDTPQTGCQDFHAPTDCCGCSGDATIIYDTVGGCDDTTCNYDNESSNCNWHDPDMTDGNGTDYCWYPLYESLEDCTSACTYGVGYFNTDNVPSSVSWQSLMNDCLGWNSWSCGYDSATNHCTAFNAGGEIECGYYPHPEDSNKFGFGPIQYAVATNEPMYTWESVVVDEAVCMTVESISEMSGDKDEMFGTCPGFCLEFEDSYDLGYQSVTPDSLSRIRRCTGDYSMEADTSDGIFGGNCDDLLDFIYYWDSSTDPEAFCVTDMDCGMSMGYVIPNSISESELIQQRIDHGYYKTPMDLNEYEPMFWCQDNKCVPNDWGYSSYDSGDNSNSEVPKYCSYYDRQGADQYYAGIPCENDCQCNLHISDPFNYDIYDADNEQELQGVYKGLRYCNDLGVCCPCMFYSWTPDNVYCDHVYNIENYSDYPDSHCAGHCYDETWTKQTNWNVSSMYHGCGVVGRQCDEFFAQAEDSGNSACLTHSDCIDDSSNATCNKYCAKNDWGYDTCEDCILCCDWCDAIDDPYTDSIGYGSGQINGCPSWCTTCPVEGEDGYCLACPDLERICINPAADDDKCGWFWNDFCMMYENCGGCPWGYQCHFGDVDPLDYQSSGGQCIEYAGSYEDPCQKACKHPVVTWPNVQYLHRDDSNALSDNYAFIDDDTYLLCCNNFDGCSYDSDQPCEQFSDCYWPPEAPSLGFGECMCERHVVIPKEFDNMINTGYADGNNQDWCHIENYSTGEQSEGWICSKDEAYYQTENGFWVQSPGNWMPVPGQGGGQYTAGCGFYNIIANGITPYGYTGNTNIPCNVFNSSSVFNDCLDSPIWAPTECLDPGSITFNIVPSYDGNYYDCDNVPYGGIPEVGSGYATHCCEYPLGEDYEYHCGSNSLQELCSYNDDSQICQSTHPSNECVKSVEFDVMILSGDLIDNLDLGVEYGFSCKWHGNMPDNICSYNDISDRQFQQGESILYWLYPTTFDYATLLDAAKHTCSMCGYDMSDASANVRITTSSSSGQLEVVGICCGGPSYGCTDASACNWNPDATSSCSGIPAGLSSSYQTGDLPCTPGSFGENCCCDYTVRGCYDEVADNDEACSTAGSSCTNEDCVSHGCLYYGCDDPMAINYHCQTTWWNDNDGGFEGCTYEPNGCGCHTGKEVGAGRSNISCPGIGGSAVYRDCCIYAGCTDKSAVNYCQHCDKDDGSCLTATGSTDIWVGINPGDISLSNITNYFSMASGNGNESVVHCGDAISSVVWDGSTEESFIISNWDQTKIISQLGYDSCMGWDVSNIGNTHCTGDGGYDGYCYITAIQEIASAACQICGYNTALWPSVNNNGWNDLSTEFTSGEFHAGHLTSTSTADYWFLPVACVHTDWSPSFPTLGCPNSFGCNYDGSHTHVGPNHCGCDYSAYYDGYCDCDSTLPDCTGLCYGDASLDECNACTGGDTGAPAGYGDVGCGCFESSPDMLCYDYDNDGIGSDTWQQELCQSIGDITDNTCLWAGAGGTGDCIAPQLWYGSWITNCGTDADDVCDGVWDDCGVCDGDNSSMGCDGICFSGALNDECMVCNGTFIECGELDDNEFCSEGCSNCAYNSESGACTSVGTSPYCGGQGNEGVFCDCAGTLYNDECGVCGGVEVDCQLESSDCSCAGCTNQFAANYDVDAITDNGTCTYNSSCNFRGWTTNVNNHGNSAGMATSPIDSTYAIECNGNDINMGFEIDWYNASDSRRQVNYWWPALDDRKDANYSASDMYTRYGVPYSSTNYRTQAYNVAYMQPVPRIYGMPTKLDSSCEGDGCDRNTNEWFPIGGSPHHSPECGFSGCCGNGEAACDDYYNNYDSSASPFDFDIPPAIHMLNEHGSIPDFPGNTGHAVCSNSVNEEPHFGCVYMLRAHSVNESSNSNWNTEYGGTYSCQEWNAGGGGVSGWCDNDSCSYSGAAAACRATKSTSSTGKYIASCDVDSEWGDGIDTGKFTSCKVNEGGCWPNNASKPNKAACCMDCGWPWECNAECNWNVRRKVSLPSSTDNWAFDGEECTLPSDINDLPAGPEYCTDPGNQEWCSNAIGVDDQMAKTHCFYLDMYKIGCPRPLSSNYDPDTTVVGTCMGVPGVNCDPYCLHCVDIDWLYSGNGVVAGLAPYADITEYVKGLHFKFDDICGCNEGYIRDCPDSDGETHNCVPEAMLGDGFCDDTYDFTGLTWDLTCYGEEYLDCNYSDEEMCVQDAIEYDITGESNSISNCGWGDNGGPEPWYNGIPAGNEGCHYNFQEYGSCCCCSAHIATGMTCEGMEQIWNWDCSGCDCCDVIDNTCDLGNGWINNCSPDPDDDSIYDCCPVSSINDQHADCEDQVRGCDLSCYGYEYAQSEGCMNVDIGGTCVGDENETACTLCSGNYYAGPDGLFLGDLVLHGGPASSEHNLPGQGEGKRDCADGVPYDIVPFANGGHGCHCCDEWEELGPGNEWGQWGSAYCHIVESQLCPTGTIKACDFEIDENEECCDPSLIGDGICHDGEDGLCDLSCYEDQGDCAAGDEPECGVETCQMYYVASCNGDGTCCPTAWLGDSWQDCEDAPYGCDLTCYDNDLMDCGESMWDDPVCPNCFIVGCEPGQTTNTFIPICEYDTCKANALSGTGALGGCLDECAGEDGGTSSSNDCQLCMINNCCIDTTSKLGQCICNEELRCYRNDGGDCWPLEICPDGFVPNCNPGTNNLDCCDANWIGDGICDGVDQQHGCDLTCYDNDGSDCGSEDVQYDMVCPFDEIISCIDTKKCVKKNKLGDGTCDADLECYNNDGMDCDGGNPCSFDNIGFYNHVPNCFPAGGYDCCPVNYIGDGYADCQDQPYGCDLTCYDNDGGACDGEGLVCPPDYLKSCDDTHCVHKNKLGDGVCDADLICYNDDGGDCLPAGNECPDGFVPNCNPGGNNEDCCNANWIGDGWADCQDQPYGCDLSCYGDDGGDCAESAEGTDVDESLCGDGFISNCNYDPVTHPPCYDCGDGTCSSDCTGDQVLGSYDCCPEGWIGDTICDGQDQFYGCDLSCYNNDGCDCNGYPWPPFWCDESSFCTDEECPGVECDSSNCDWSYIGDGVPCCDYMWYQYGWTCAQMEAGIVGDYGTYVYDCSGCVCPGDNGVSQYCASFGDCTIVSP